MATPIVTMVGGGLLGVASAYLGGQDRQSKARAAQEAKLQVREDRTGTGQDIATLNSLNNRLQNALASGQTNRSAVAAKLRAEATRLAGNNPLGSKEIFSSLTPLLSSKGIGDSLTVQEIGQQATLDRFKRAADSGRVASFMTVEQAFKGSQDQEEFEVWQREQEDKSAFNQRQIDLGLGSQKNADRTKADVALKQDQDILTKDARRRTATEIAKKTYSTVSNSAVSTFTNFLEGPITDEGRVEAIQDLQSQLAAASQNWKSMTSELLGQDTDVANNLFAPLKLQITDMISNLKNLPTEFEKLQQLATKAKLGVDIQRDTYSAFLLQNNSDLLKIVSYVNLGGSQSIGLKYDLTTLPTSVITSFGDFLDGRGREYKVVFDALNLEEPTNNEITLAEKQEINAIIEAEDAAMRNK